MLISVENDHESLLDLQAIVGVSASSGIRLYSLSQVLRFSTLFIIVLSEPILSLILILKLLPPASLCIHIIYIKVVTD